MPSSMCPLSSSRRSLASFVEPEATAQSMSHFVTNLLERQWRPKLMLFRVWDSFDLII